MELPLKDFDKWTSSFATSDILGSRIFIYLEVPKSVNLISACASINILAPFISLCNTLFLCK